MLRLLELVRRLGAGIVALTGNADSTLARHADVHLNVGVDREACSLDLVPTASTCAALAMGDALAVAAYEQRGFTSKDFARFHPGGQLGHRLRLVRSVMHQGEELPSVHEDAEMKQALDAGVAPKIRLAATEESALEFVTLEELSDHALDLH